MSHNNYILNCEIAGYSSLGYIATQDFSDNFGVNPKAYASFFYTIVDQQDDDIEYKKYDDAGYSQVASSNINMQKKMMNICHQLFQEICTDCLKIKNPEIDMDSKAVIHNNSVYMTGTFKELQSIVCFELREDSGKIFVSTVILSINLADKGYCKLVDFATSKVKQHQQNRENSINMITYRNNRFALVQIPMPTNRSETFTYDLYNQSFEPVGENIIKHLSTKSESGLVLLHGIAGVGKTSFLKHLIHTKLNKSIIYVPPDLIPQLSSPAFFDFLIDNAQNSILLIEDAENVLKKRHGGGDQAVSNILNISDGILGDVLQVQIVCTFNCPLEEIDEALLRPGRLIAEYQFEKLDIDRSRAIVEKIYDSETALSVTTPLTIAEVFNLKDMPHKTDINKTQPFGFLGK